MSFYMQKNKTVFDFNLFFPSLYKKNVFGLILEVILDPMSTRRETKIQVKITKKKTDGKLVNVLENWPQTVMKVNHQERQEIIKSPSELAHAERKF